MKAPDFDYVKPDSIDKVYSLIEEYGDDAGAARAEGFREGDKQVDRQDEQIAYESNLITPPNLHKTARKGPFGLEFRNSPPTGWRRTVSSRRRELFDLTSGG